MGIGNTASAALLTHGITAMPLADCVGRGTGLDDAGVASKLATLGMALARRARCTDPVELLTEYGGYEIAMLVGAILGAAARGLLVIVDGFTVAHAQGYCVFGHVSAEKAHRALLAQLQVRPLLDLGMRLGEGSGAALALPVVQSAVALFTQMATFAGAGVSEKSA
jgi:nicotinate-nucleotide--dimethylbenzimidazole phosphoribosyltransferase